MPCWFRVSPLTEGNEDNEGFPSFGRTDPLFPSLSSVWNLRVSALTEGNEGNEGFSTDVLNPILRFLCYLLFKTFAVYPQQF